MKLSHKKVSKNEVSLKHKPCDVGKERLKKDVTGNRCVLAQRLIKAGNAGAFLLFKKCKIFLLAFYTVALHQLLIAQDPGGRILAKVGVLRRISIRKQTSDATFWDDMNYGP